jgi:predicted esterase
VNTFNAHTFRAAFAMFFLASCCLLPVPAGTPVVVTHASAHATSTRVVGGHIGTLPPLTVPDADFHLYLPTDAATRGPLQVLVAVHGMGGNGVSFGASLIAAAERHGWILVAPTFRYRDNFNPGGVLQDDTELIPRLKQYLDELPQKTGLPIRDKVLLYGFSRGGQIAHRFAEFYPDRTLAVAVFAAGTYSLPVASMAVDGLATTLDLPFGIADVQQYTHTPFNLDAFRHVPFYIGVGGADTAAGVAPPAWDPYVGSTRLARSENFAHALQSLGMTVSFAIYPGVGHAVTDPMRDAAVAFLAAHADPDGVAAVGTGPGSCGHCY